MSSQSNEIWRRQSAIPTGSNNNNSNTNNRRRRSDIAIPEDTRLLPPGYARASDLQHNHSGARARNANATEAGPAAIGNPRLRLGSLSYSDPEDRPRIDRRIRAIMLAEQREVGRIERAVNTTIRAEVRRMESERIQQQVANARRWTAELLADVQARAELDRGQRAEEQAGQQPQTLLHNLPNPYAMFDPYQIQPSDRSSSVSTAPSSQYPWYNWRNLNISAAHQGGSSQLPPPSQRHLDPHGARIAASPPGARSIRWLDRVHPWDRHSSVIEARVQIVTGASAGDIERETSPSDHQSRGEQQGQIRRHSSQRQQSQQATPRSEGRILAREQRDQKD